MTPAEGARGFRHFHEQLATPRARLLQMSDAAESLVALAVASLLRGDAAEAGAVIAGDHVVNSARSALRVARSPALVLLVPGI